ncbi:Uncharacterised protein [Bordetella pertussis]|nr:Uncharacterised protein [Bordetella pertussis]
MIQPKVMCFCVTCGSMTAAPWKNVACTSRPASLK